MIKRILAMLLAALLIAVTLTACGGGTKIEKRDKSKDRSDSSESSVESLVGSSENEALSEEAESAYEDSSESSDNQSDPSADEIPDNFEDSSGSEGNDIVVNTDGFLDARFFDDIEINILSRNAGEDNYATYQVDTNYDSYDPIISAMYQRNKYIRETYGIEIDVVYPQSGEDVVTMLRQDFLSGNGEYHAVVHPVAYLAPLAAEGWLADFNGVENGYVRLDKDYWDQSLIRDLSINDKVFFLNGDAFVTDDESTYGIFFNKDLIAEYGLENPYELVRSGQWTLDKMYEMLQEVDLTHGSYKSFEPIVGDRWGMVTQFYDFSLLMQGAGQRMVDNSGDFPQLRINDESNVFAFKSITEWFSYGSNDVGVADYHGPWDSGVYEKEKEIFANGNALFMPNYIGIVNDIYMRDTYVNYGIIPMPKGSAAQETYASGVNVYNCDVVAIPYNNQGETLDATCYALEAMAYYGKALVTPEHYHKLAFRRFGDDDSVEMLDVILKDRIYDMGTVFNFNGGNEYQGTLYFYTNLLSERRTDIETLYDQLKWSFQTGIDDLVFNCYN